MTRKRKSKFWRDYPVRRCYTMHECSVCKKMIRNGESYYDMNGRRRAHIVCGIESDYKREEKALT